jgi:hypothetical protein
VKYAHLFWKLFGVPLAGWDSLPYWDYVWMKSTADDYAKQEREAAKS